MDKKELRRELLKKRDSLSPKEQERARVLITERLLGHQWFCGSDILLGFVSFGSEIGTGDLLEEARRKGKKVYVPRVEGEDMVFYRYEGAAELTEGYRGILEPAGREERYAYDPEQAGRTLILMPGVGFDPFRNRLGYGKGFYDRFLSDKEGLQLRSIAIGHSCQMVERLPQEEHDVRPYQVLCV